MTIRKRSKQVDLGFGSALLLGAAISFAGTVSQALGSDEPTGNAPAIQVPAIDAPTTQTEESDSQPTGPALVDGNGATDNSGTITPSEQGDEQIEDESNVNTRALDTDFD